jgi:hypothetical protein
LSKLRATDDFKQLPMRVKYLSGFQDPARRADGACVAGNTTTKARQARLCGGIAWNLGNFWRSLTCEALRPTRVVGYRRERRLTLAEFPRVEVKTTGRDDCVNSNVSPHASDGRKKLRAEGSPISRVCDFRDRVQRIFRTRPAKVFQT